MILSALHKTLEFVGADKAASIVYEIEDEVLEKQIDAQYRINARKEGKILISDLLPDEEGNYTTKEKDEKTSNSWW